MTRDEFVAKIHEIDEALWELRRNAPDVIETSGHDRELYEALWNTCEHIEYSSNTLRQQACYVEGAWSW